MARTATGNFRSNPLLHGGRGLWRSRKLGRPRSSRCPKSFARVRVPQRWSAIFSNLRTIVQMLTRPPQGTTRRSTRAPIIPGHCRPFLLFSPKIPSCSLEAVRNLLSKVDPRYLPVSSVWSPSDFVASHPPHLVPGRPIGVGSDPFVAGPSDVHHPHYTPPGEGYGCE